MLVGVVVENFQKCRDIIEKDRLAEKEKEREKEKARKRQSGTIIHRQKLNQLLETLKLPSNRNHKSGCRSL